MLRDRSRVAGATLAGVVLLAGLVALFYVGSLHAGLANSDKATTILQGQSMAHGNLLLRGWRLSNDSHWTNDALLAMIGVLIVGVRPQLLYLEPAVAAALFVLAGVLVVRLAASTRAAVLAGAATVIALIALPSMTLLHFLLAGAWHVGTAVWALAAFAAFRAARFGTGWALGVCCLAIGTLGDLDLVAYGMIPIACAGMLRMLRQRDLRAGLPLVAGAAAAGAAFEVIEAVLVAAHAFTQGSGKLPFVGGGQIARNVGGLLRYGGEMLGVTPGYAASLVPRPLQYVHVVTAAAILAALVIGVRHALAGLRRHRAGDVVPPATELESMLVLGVGGSIGTYLVQATGNFSEARYLTAGVLFACVLCGVVVARTWPPKFVSGRLKPAAVIVAAVMVALFASGLGFLLAWNGYVPVPAQLTAWLEAHHLRSGIGDYWSASIVTVESGGAVTVRPVSAAASDRIVPMDQSTESWYDGKTFQFLVYDSTEWLDVDAATAARSYGTPAHTYLVAGYHILVWSHSIRVPSPQHRTDRTDRTGRGQADRSASGESSIFQAWVSRSRLELPRTSLPALTRADSRSSP
jgi:hypothetical protein